MNSNASDSFINELINEITDNETTEQTEEINNTNNTQQNYQQFSHNTFIGQQILENKSDGIFRLIAGNPNGLKLNATGGDLHEYLEEAKRMSADAILLYEINLDTQQHKVKQTIYETCHNLFNYNKVTFSSSAVPAKNQFKPRGTMICTNDNASGRVLASGTDNMGRWSHQTLSCKNHKNLAIFSAYQVCHQQIVQQGRIKTLTATAQ